MPSATTTPLIGCSGRCLRSRLRKPRQALASAALSESWLVYRPAVSTSTASSANQKSRFRVPPTPFRALSENGNRRPEFKRAVVLPAPGGPMIMYQGRL